MKIWRVAFERHWLLITFLVLTAIALSLLQVNAFFTARNLLNVARSFSWIAIAAFGESLVIIIGGIDLSVGAVMALAGLISALGMQIGLPVPLAVTAGLLTGAFVGWLNGTIVGNVKLPPFIVTLATMSIARGVTHVLSSGWSVTDLPAGFRALGQSDLDLGLFAIPLPFLIMLVLALAVYLLTKHTLIGRYIYTLANNEQALLVTGVNVAQIKIATYTLCGFLAALGGLLMTARLGVATPSAAVGYELDIIASAVIGGISLFGGGGNIFGVLLGAAFLQMLRNGLVLSGLHAYWQEAMMGAMVLLAIFVDYWQQKRTSPWMRQSAPGANTQDTVIGRLVKRKSYRMTVFVASALILFAIVMAWQVVPRWMQGSATGDGPVNQQVLTIAWIPKALDNPVFELGYQGAVERATELSSDGPIQVKIMYVGSVTSNAAEQIRVIEDVIARGVDAIAVSCIDPVACIDPINKAVAQGIPVMTWDSDSPQSQRFTYLGVDNYQAGQAAAGLLVGAMGQQGKVAILTGVPGAYNLEERVRGFEDSLISYPNIQIVTTVVSNDDINQGIQVVEDTMQAYPDLDGWFFVGMWPLFADRGSMPLWEEAASSGRLKTVAFDTLPVELELLQDGYLSGLVGQKYWGWGYDTIQIIYDRLVHHKTFPAFINSGIDIVTANNVDAMLRAWEANDFSQPLPEP